VRSAVPEDATVPLRGEGAPEVGELIASHYRMCFACGSDHPSGLHLRVTAGPEVSVIGELVIGEHHQGAPGLAHGGVIATAMDEMMGSLQILIRKPAVTAHLETDFHRPVPVGTTLRVEARAIGQVGRKVYCEAVAFADGDRVVSAAAVFIQVPIEHFTTQGDPELVQRAKDERRTGSPRWWGEVNP
jgi:acyl-coenzyme A thioesterase PaaI-like protein